MLHKKAQTNIWGGNKDGKRVWEVQRKELSSVLHSDWWKFYYCGMESWEKALTRDVSVQKLWRTGIKFFFAQYAALLWNSRNMKSAKFTCDLICWQELRLWLNTREQNVSDVADAEVKENHMEMKQNDNGVGEEGGETMLRVLSRPLESDYPWFRVLHRRLPHRTAIHSHSVLH